MYADKSDVEKSWSGILEGVVDMVCAGSAESSAAEKKCSKLIAFWAAEVGKTRA